MGIQSLRAFPLLRSCRVDVSSRVEVGILFRMTSAMVRPLIILFYVTIRLPPGSKVYAPVRERPLDVHRDGHEHTPGAARERRRHEPQHKRTSSTNSSGCVSARLPTDFLLDHTCVMLQAGDTALLLAAGSGLVKHVQLLLQHGADVYARDGTGRTALELAAAWGYADIVQILITAAPDLLGIAGVHYVTHERYAARLR